MREARQPLPEGPCSLTPSSGERQALLSLQNLFPLRMDNPCSWKMAAWPTYTAHLKVGSQSSRLGRRKGGRTGHGQGIALCTLGAGAETWSRGPHTHLDWQAPLPSLVWTTGAAASAPQRLSMGVHGLGLAALAPAQPQSLKALNRIQ